VLQPGFEVGGFPFAEGLSIGAWGNLDLGDYGGRLADGQFSEIDLTGSYAVPLPTDAVGVSLGYTEYAYPNAELKADREVNVGVELGLPLTPSASVNYGVGGGIEQSLYVEVGIGEEQEIGEHASVGLSAAAGYVAPDEGPEGFSHYTATFSVSAYCLTASISYVGRIEDEVLPDVDDGGSYDVDLLGRIGLGLDF